MLSIPKQTYSLPVIQIGIADFRQRSREKSFLVSILLLCVLTMFAFPVTDTNYQTLEISGYRGIYDSAWMGATLAMLEVIFLPIMCFYLVKNAVEKDRLSQVDSLLAYTQMTKLQYIIGKWLANFSLLVCISLVMVVISISVQFWIGESYNVNPFDYLLPQLIFVWPTLAIIAAMAILFESFKWLRGGLGNVAYFFLWVSLMANSIEGVSGIGAVMEQMDADVLAIDPTALDSSSLGISVGTGEEIPPLKTFEWRGIDYQLDWLYSVLGMSLICLMLLVIAVALFDRFSKSRSLNNNLNENNILFNILSKLSLLTLPLTKIFELTSFSRMIRQEFLLLFKGWSPYFYLLFFGLVAAQLSFGVDTIRQMLLPASFLVCVLCLSPMGQREIKENAHQLIFYCPSPIKMQLPASLVAATLLLILATSGALIKFLLAGEWLSIGLLLLGCFFVSTFALLCGSLSRTSRTFEIMFTVLWYIGPLQRNPNLDFIGINPEANIEVGSPVYFAITALMFILLSLWSKKKQLRYV